MKPSVPFENPNKISPKSVKNFKVYPQQLAGLALAAVLMLTKGPVGHIIASQTINELSFERILEDSKVKENTTIDDEMAAGNLNSNILQRADKLEKIIRILEKTKHLKFSKFDMESPMKIEREYIDNITVEDVIELINQCNDEKNPYKQQEAKKLLVAIKDYCEDWFAKNARSTCIDLLMIVVKGSASNSLGSSIGQTIILEEKGAFSRIEVDGIMYSFPLNSDESRAIKKIYRLQEGRAREISQQEVQEALELAKKALNGHPSVARKNI